MALKRYFATKDNTITNAFKANLQTRGVSGNMGQSDILEIFHIYAQASATSQENCKVLIQFNIDQIDSDRTDGTIPASGSVNFFLKMYNAEHSQTTPKDFTVVVNAVSQSWQEGLGLDMENYSDIDESNWLYASDTDIAASASVTAMRFGVSEHKLHLTGATSNYVFESTNDTDTPGYFDWGTSTAEVATNVATIINASASDDFSANAVGSIVYITSSAPGADGNTNSLTSSMHGAGGPRMLDITGSDSVANDGLSGTFSGGNNFTPWTTEGGDYITGSDASPLEYTFTQHFNTGFEDLEIDVSHLVEDWISQTAPVENNYGFGVHLTGTLTDAANSYYTKMFFARGSQFFLKRPVIEARWDSSKKDDRGNFYLSSSLVPAADNLMTLYLYNIVKGNLTNIPAVGTNVINVSIYSGSANNTAPAGSKIGLSIGGGTVAADDINTTASWVETGIYSCSFAYTSSAITTIFDVWHSGGVEYHTGSAIAVNTFNSQDYNFDQNYVSNVTNLHAWYTTAENARFRLYVREKDWSPTIYTVASKDIETSIIQDAYYKIVRVQDGFEVVPFGTGSLNYTRLSYDVSGSYFDLKMNLFDTDTVYEMSFAYVINGSYVEQPEKFRFRIE